MAALVVTKYTDFEDGRNPVVQTLEQRENVGPLQLCAACGTIAVGGTYQTCLCGAPFDVDDSGALVTR